MTDKTRLLKRLGEAYRMLLSALQICRACGHLSMAETQRLRDGLFALSARCRTASEEAVGELTGERLRDAAQALSHAALCLLSGPNDGQQWCSVDAKKLACCLDELEPVLMALEQAQGSMPGN